MAVTDLTSLISPGMQLVRSEQAVAQLQDRQPKTNSSRNLDFERAEAELQAAFDDLEKAGTNYNELVDSYNAAGSAAEQARLEPLIDQRAAEFNSAVRRYNEAGQKYQDAGIITGFSALEEFTPVREERKPTLSALPDATLPENGKVNWWTTPLYKTAAQNIESNLQNSGDDIRKWWTSPLYPAIISDVKETASKLWDNLNEPLLPKEQQQKIISNAQQSPQQIGIAGDVLKEVVVSGTKPQEQRDNLKFLTSPLLPRETQKEIIASIKEVPDILGEKFARNEPLISRETQQKYIDNIPNVQRVGQIALGTIFTDRILKSGETAVNTVTTVSNFAQTPANASPEEQEALKLQRQDFLSGILNTVFPVAPDNLISDVSDKLTGKTDAQILQEQKDYMTTLGNTLIDLGASLSKESPQIGQLLEVSGGEILVSRDFQTEGLISKNDMGLLQINRPSIYDVAAFGGVLGAAGAAVGTGAVTGVSGFGPLIAKSAPLAIQGETVASYMAGGGRSAGQALANAAATESFTKSALAGASALGISLSEVDYGIGDILDQYPRRDEERGVTVPMPGEVGIGNGILDEYPSRDKYGSGNRNQYNRNNNNRNEDWNRSELDYRGNVGSGYSTRLVEDNLYRSRYQEANQNRYRNEFDYIYEYATVADAFPRSRRRASYEEEEEDIIAEPRRKGKRKKSRFTERLIL